MIKANELRIGNVIMQKDKFITITDGFVKVEFFDWQIIIGDHEIDLTDCQPIPLTPDILEKCGVMKVEPEGWFGLIPKKKGGQMLLFFKPEKHPLHYADGCASPDILSVHQLQNLYFALTGEELTINL